jgi:hypothetical protein
VCVISETASKSSKQSRLNHFADFDEENLLVNKLDHYGIRENITAGLQTSLLTDNKQ